MLYVNYISVKLEKKKERTKKQKLVWGFSSTPPGRTPSPCNTPTRESCPQVPHISFLAVAQPNSLKKQLHNVPWSHSHSPLFMGSARSDKISFSELVPNLITLRISAGLPWLQGTDSEGTGATSHELHFSFGSWWRVSCSGAFADQRGLERWAWARRAPSVHPTSLLSPANQEGDLQFY